MGGNIYALVAIAPWSMGGTGSSFELGYLFMGGQH